jgi:peptidoglycan/LPS O-acetylase OafA/YrhL
VLGLAILAATMHTFPRATFVLAAAYALLLIANFQRHNVTNWGLQRLGEMSYTLYVTHIQAIVLWSLYLQHMGRTHGLASASLWLWMTAVPFGLGVAYAVYWLVERPSHALLKAMRRKPAISVPEGVEPST